MPSLIKKREIMMWYGNLRFEHCYPYVCLRYLENDGRICCLRTTSLPSLIINVAFSKLQCAVLIIWFHRLAQCGPVREHRYRTCALDGVGVALVTPFWGKSTSPYKITVTRHMRSVNGPVQYKSHIWKCYSNIQSLSLSFFIFFSGLR